MRLISALSYFHSIIDDAAKDSYVAGCGNAAFSLVISFSFFIWELAVICHHSEIYR